MVFELHQTLVLFSWQSVWATFVSMFAIWCVFFLPGSFFLAGRWKHLSLPIRWSMAVLVGIAFWGVQGYVLGYLQLRWASVLYVLTMMILAGKQLRATRPVLVAKELINSLRQDLPTWGFLGVGSMFQLFFVLGSGWQTTAGVKFWFLNAFDGVMHLAFTQELAQNFPAMQPGAVGIPLTHYHYWADLIAADLARVWGLPVAFLSFQVLPILLSFVGSSILIGFVKELGGSKWAQRWALFFQFFAGNALWIFMMVFQRSFGWHLPAIDNGFIQFSNTPQAFAKFLFLAALMLVMSWIRRKHFVDGVLAALLFGSLFGFKVYFGVFAAMSWSLFLAYQTVLTLRRPFSWNEKVRLLLPEFILYGILGFFSLAVYLPPNMGAGGLFFVPMAWPRLLISAQYLNWNEWWLRRQVYESFGNWKWLVILDAALAIVFFLGVFGSRLLGVWAGWKVRQQVGTALWLFLFVPSLLFIFIGMNFLQTSGEYNVFNFFIVALLPLSLFLSLWLEKLRGPVLWVLSILILVSSLPRPLGDFIRAADQVRRSENAQTATHADLEMFSWLETHTQPNEIIQPHFRHKMDYETPWTPFFTNRKAYLSGTGILKSHNQPVVEREKMATEAYRGFTEYEIAAFFLDTDTRYGILRNADEPALFVTSPQKGYLRVVYENAAGKVVEPVALCRDRAYSPVRTWARPITFP